MNLFCQGQITLTKQGKKNFEAIFSEKPPEEPVKVEVPVKKPVLKEKVKTPIKEKKPVKEKKVEKKPVKTKKKKNSNRHRQNKPVWQPA